MPYYHVSTDAVTGLVVSTQFSTEEETTHANNTFAQSKVAKLAQLEQARDAAERANVTVAGKVYSGSESFQAKVSRQINQTGRGKPIAGANDAWRTADAQPVVMTTALLGLIEEAITAQGAAAWARFWQRVDAVQAATTNEAVNAVIW